MSVLGTWRIVDRDPWDQDAVDLVAPGFIEFEPDSLGSFGFIAVEGASTGQSRCATVTPASSSPGGAMTRVIPPAVMVPHRVPDRPSWSQTP